MISLVGAQLLAVVFGQSISRPALPDGEPGEGSRAAPLPAGPAGEDLEERGAARRAHRARPLDRETLRALFAADPPVEALRAAATAMVLAEPARARSLVERARLAGWLPEVRILIDRRFARTESVDLGTSTDSAALAPVGIDSNNDVRYQCRATWDLSKLIFNPDEIAAQFQALRTADTRREIESLVIRLYFERRRLKAESASADDPDMPSSWRRDLRLSEIEAELDALTGGRWSQLARPRPIEGESSSGL